MYGTSTNSVPVTFQTKGWVPDGVVVPGGDVTSAGRDGGHPRTNSVGMYAMESTVYVFTRAGATKVTTRAGEEVPSDAWWPGAFVLLRPDTVHGTVSLQFLQIQGRGMPDVPGGVLGAGGEVAT